MSILSKTVRRITGRTIGENLGTFIGTKLGGPAGGMFGEVVGGTFTEELSNRTGGETTTTQTVQSANAPVGYGPASNIEIDFSGRGDMGGIMPAMYTNPFNLPSTMQMNPMVQPAFAPALPAIGGAAAGLAADQNRS